AGCVRGALGIALSSHTGEQSGRWRAGGTGRRNGAAQPGRGGASARAGGTALGQRRRFESNIVCPRSRRREAGIISDFPVDGPVDGTGEGRPSAPRASRVEASARLPNGTTERPRHLGGSYSGVGGSSCTSLRGCGDGNLRGSSREWRSRGSDPNAGGAKAARGERRTAAGIRASGAHAAGWFRAGVVRAGPPGGTTEAVGLRSDGPLERAGSAVRTRRGSGTRGVGGPVFSRAQPVC